jgi:hypothetical protein
VRRPALKCRPEGLDALGVIRKAFTVGFAALQLTVVACSGGGDQPDTSGCNVESGAIQTSGPVTVTNDSCLLEKQMDRTTSLVPIEPTAEMKAAPLRAIAARTSTITLTLAASVSPPVVNGTTLMAAGVTIKSNLALVSYMVKGDARAGALDVIKITDEQHPVLMSRATFSNADIIAADFDEGTVWYVGASDDRSFAAPAFLGAIKLTGEKLDPSETGTTGLLSYAGTSVAVSGKNRIYTTSGSSGAFSAYTYNKGTFTKLFDYQMHDARAAYWATDRVGVVGGTPGKLAVFDESGTAPLATYGFTGADLPEAKSGVELAGGKAFIAAGTGGVQVLSLATGKLVGHLARPDGKALGLDPSVVTTNGVSIDGDLLFICNGEAGIYVAQGADKFSATGSEAAQTITLAGQLKLGALQSANHVAYRNKYLMIATGLGGLKIVVVNES